MATILDNIKSSLEKGIPIKVEVESKVYIKLAITILIVAAIIVLSLILYRRYK